MGPRVTGGERLGRGWARSTDFDGISPYQEGDDVRRIHWHATARTGHVQMRRFAAQSHRAHMLVVDLHPGLCFGTRDRLMAKTAVLVAARLAWEALAAQEPIGLAVGGDSILEPRRGKRHVSRLLERLQVAYAAACQGAASVMSWELLEQASALLQRGDEIYLVSDFGEIDRDFERRSLALAEVHALRALVVEDPLFSMPIPSGRYPLRVAARGRPQTAAVGREEAERTGEAIETLRRARRRRLEDCGWDVEGALGMLPRGQDK